MRKLCATMILALLIATTAFASNSDGFVPIFNGKDLSGWVVGGKAEGFRVVDGCIFSEGGKGGEWIRTAKQYGNFVIRMEWMLSKTGNSGILIRHGVPSPGFIEAQLLAPWTPYRDDLHCTGSIYGHVPANPRPDETTLRWRTAEISAVWKSITVKIDGVKTSEGSYDTVPSMKGLPLLGYVGMQDSHTSPGEWVKFRNIEIRDLDRDPLFLTKGLLSSDPDVRRAAYDSSVRLGPPMVVPMLDALARADEPRAHVLEMALSRVVAESSAPGSAKQANEVRVALLDRLESGGSTGGRDKIAAAKMLGLIGRDDRRTSELLKRTYLKKGPASAAAFDSLQRLPGPTATKALVEALQQSEPADQPEVLLALRSRRDPAAFSGVLKILETKNQEVRLAAVQTLGTLSTAKMVPLIISVASNSSPEVRGAAVDSLIGLIQGGTLTPKDRKLAIESARRLAVTEAQKAAVAAERGAM